MTTYNRQYANIPMPGDISGTNLTGTDIPADNVVCLDTTAGNLVPLFDGLSVVLPATGGNPDTALGVTQETLKALATGTQGSPGRVRTQGVVRVVCDGAVTVKGFVDASVTTAGRVKAHAAGKTHMGQALMTGADGDTIEILLTPGGAPNA